MEFTKHVLLYHDIIRNLITMVIILQPFVALAVRCIQVDNLADTYTHALVAYAMSLYKPTSRFTEILINRLLKKARIEGNRNTVELEYITTCK